MQISIDLPEQEKINKGGRPPFSQSYRIVNEIWDIELFETKIYDADEGLNAVVFQTRVKRKNLKELTLRKFSFKRLNKEKIQVTRIV